MAYADYDFYTDEFMGKELSAEDFPRLANLASTFLDYYTMGRAAKMSDLPALKMCCCALAERYKSVEEAQISVADGVSSETTGKWSRTFRTNAEISASIRTDLANIAKTYLIGTGLLYRGASCFRT